MAYLKSIKVQLDAMDGKLDDMDVRVQMVEKRATGRQQQRLGRSRPTKSATIGRREKEARKAKEITPIPFDLDGDDEDAVKEKEDQARKNTEEEKEQEQLTPSRRRAISDTQTISVFDRVVKKLTKEDLQLKLLNKSKKGKNREPSKTSKVRSPSRVLTMEKSIHKESRMEKTPPQKQKKEEVVESYIQGR